MPFEARRILTRASASLTGADELSKMEYQRLNSDLIESKTAEHSVSADSESQRAVPLHMGSLADVQSSRLSSLSSNPPSGQIERNLSDLSAPSSTPLKESRILKGTGPALNPSSSHRQRPDVTYNLKELSHMTRSPSMNQNTTTKQQLPQHIELTKEQRFPLYLDEQKLVATTNGHAELHSAKRQRISEGNNSPKSFGQGHLWNTVTSPEEFASLVPDVNQELVAYVWPILLNGGVTNPSELLGLAFFKPFIYHQRKRDVQWNPTTHCTRWSFRTKIDIVALLVQLTGDCSPKCCNRCDPETGLFKGCIVTNSQTLARAYYGCANCLYHGRQTFCNLKGWNRHKDVLDLDHEHSVTHGIAVQQDEASKSTTNTHPKHVLSTPDAIGSWNSATKLNGNTPVKVSLTAAERRNEEFIEPSEILSMEPWERAPGRIRSQVSATPESKHPYAPERSCKLTIFSDIAFSKSYLATGLEVQVCREATFQVAVIRSGHTHKFQPEDNIMRICSVASAGKLSIKLNGEEPLTIGSHGMFTIRPRSECLVECEIYDDVALHVTSIKTG